MSSSPVIQIGLTERAQTLVEKYQAMPLLIARATRQGLDDAMPLVLEKITEERLTGQGPFPVEEHRLGVRSGQLRQSAYTTPAESVGAVTTSRVGSPLFYAGLNEFGATYTRTSKPGRARLRTNKRGELIKRGNLATFAGRRHKLVKEVPYAGGKSYEVHVPARHSFGFGLADSVPIITRKVSERIVAALDPRNETGGQP